MQTALLTGALLRPFQGTILAGYAVAISRPTQAFYEYQTLENLLPNSEALAGWNKGANTTITARGDGTFRIQWANTTGTWAEQAIGVSLTAGVQYTISVDLQLNGAGNGAIQFGVSNAAGGAAFVGSSSPTVTATMTRYSFNYTPGSTGTYYFLFDALADVDVIAAHPQVQTASPGGAYLPTGPRVIQRYFVDNDVLRTRKIGGLTAFKVERGAVNNLLWATDFTNVAWAKTNVTASVTAQAAHLPGLTMEKLDETAITATHTTQQTITTTIGTAYTATFFVKAAQRQWAIVYFFDTVGGHGAFVDLTNGAVGAAVGTGATVRTKVLGNTVIRIDVTYTAAAASTQVVLGIAQANLTDNYLGVVGNGIYVWYGGCEAGAQGTSPIITTTAAAGRSGDVVTIASGIADSRDRTVLVAFLPDLLANGAWQATWRPPTEWMAISGTGGANASDGTNTAGTADLSGDKQWHWTAGRYTASGITAFGDGLTNTAAAGRPNAQAGSTYLGSTAGSSDPFCGEMILAFGARNLADARVVKEASKIRSVLAAAGEPIAAAWT